MVKYVFTYSKSTLKKDQQKTPAMKLKRCLCVFIFLSFFIKAYVVGTYLDCIDRSMQFRWVPITYFFIKK